MKVEFQSLDFIQNGWHACADARADFFIGNTGDPIVAWMYVTSKKNNMILRHSGIVADLKDLSTDGELDSYGDYYCTMKQPQLYSSFMRNGSVNLANLIFS
ncbi:hypothetical protein QAD02_004664 [Eretmocerus hayati]|uniref:Uncharacterized protein n=1 Tax=Eretmocerus hayati TaxID=131215 RepID=A0ACC2NQK8_9HYME|nr:hypothetical protein QAD02_004664 [Eretmocerus hayati]